MAKSNFFFQRQEFTPPEIHKPYYTYLGYFLKKDEKNDERYPISIYFGKDEIAVYYTRDDNQLLKIFSLYVAEGEINQLMLAKKVEDYAKMPLWPLSDELLKDELKRMCVDPALLHIGFFASYYGFECNKDRFSEVYLPGSRSDVIHIEDENRLLFRYGDEQEGKDKPNEDRWTLVRENVVEKIKATKINFSKILLDFLFEIDFANTFEDENFFALQPHLQNNLVLDALTKKCRYLSGLNNLRGFSQEKRNQHLPKPFQDVEKEWLNTCRLESYKPVFVSPNSLFDDPESEVKNICFKATIGEGRKKRKEYLKSKEDARLKNEICTFFMRKYNIWSAFRVLMPEWAILLAPFILLAIPLGDHFLDKESEYVGVFSIGLPMAILLFMFVYHISRGINLFKLLLPRLFLGIMIGWSVFWSTEELWKKALTTNSTMVLVFDAFLLVVIFLFIFTDIANKMYRKIDGRIFLKTLNLMFIALIVSFVMGFYVIQFYAKPMLENSGFLNAEILFDGKAPETSLCLDQFFEWENLKPKIKYFVGDGEESAWKNYKKRAIELFRIMGDGHIRYIWSILFSQFVVSILFGIVLQLLWEDRPITEPL